MPDIMLYNILPHELYDEAEKSLRIIRKDLLSMNAELIIQNQRLLAMSTQKPLCHGARYGLFEIHANVTTIRNGYSIPHTHETYITAWTWDNARKYLTSINAYGIEALKRPREDEIIIEL